jgi:hypothetical protein
MMMLKRKWFFQGAVVDGADGSASTDSAAGAADPAAGSGGAAPVVPPVADAGADTALAAGAAANLPPQVSIPEKYQVKKPDGTLDIEASSLKLAEAYGHLEKRVGTGDLPPKEVGDYKITIPEQFPDWKPAEDPKLQAFLKEAHTAGMTQKQVDVMVSKYMEIAPELVQASHKMDADTCTAELKTVWKTDDQYKSEVGKAYKAAVGYFGADADAIIKEYGNDARIVRGLAKLGGEMGEDKSVHFEGAQMGQSSIDTLMASEAYNQSKHPDHANVSNQVRIHFEKLAAAAEKAGAVPLM